MKIMQYYLCYSHYYKNVESIKHVCRLLYNACKKYVKEYTY